MSFMSNSSGPYDVLIKVMMLGHSSVGKSSMVSSLCEQPFSPSHLHTIGIDFRVKHYHLKGKRVKLQVWDSAGQERYDTIIKPYYREAQAFVLVFDLTNRDTFDQLHRWIENIGLYGSAGEEELVLVLAGNKCDLVSPGSPHEKADRGVDETEIKHMCEVHNMTYWETSAKTRQNIDQMFVHAAEQVLKKKGLDLTLDNSETVKLQTGSAHQRAHREGEKERKKCCKFL